MVYNFSVYKVFLLRSRNDSKVEVLEGEFRNLNFWLSTKKTTEYSFDLYLSIYRYKIFFLRFKTSVLSHNCFSK